MLAALVVLAAAPERLALVIGVNQSVDPQLKALQYADDDAARYHELFEQLGAQTVLLARLDESSARLHPRAAQAAALPIGAELDRAVAALGERLDDARSRGATVELYVVYAGHGNVRDGDGYLTLEDERLGAGALAARIFDRLPADRSHFIVDACYSSFLAVARGPGGERAPAEGFSDAARLHRVGLLLSTASARESHEWEGFQAGVFSHEVRSGLLGAADADGDGRITYRELGAFVHQANAAIANEKYRPDVHARPPPGGEVLLDLRGVAARRLEVPAALGAHWLMEDTRGVRVLDFNNAGGAAVSVLRPSAGGALYLRRTSDEQEYALPDADGTVQLSSLTPKRARVATRGAAHDAFSLAFSLPFGAEVAAKWRPVALPDVVRASPGWRRPVALASMGAGLVAAGIGAVFTVSAFQVRGSILPQDTQRVAAERNAQVQGYNTASVALYCAAGALALTAIALLVWGWASP